MIEADWRNGSELDRFLGDHRQTMLPFFGWFADLVEGEASPAVAASVVTMQIVIGCCLLLNQYVRPALWAGIVLNVTLTLAGQVNPSAFYLVTQIALLIELGPLAGDAIVRRRAVMLGSLPWHCCRSPERSDLLR